MHTVFTLWPGRFALFFALVLLFSPKHVLPQIQNNYTLEDDVKSILARECINLSKDRLYALLAPKLASESGANDASEILKIVDGVVKRTDFDGISEEKTVEIISLVLGAFRKGAPLEYLDEIFDVAYAKTVTVDRLAAAAKALKEFSSSDVPQEIYEEFVYHSIEDEWDPEAVPVLTRGLIYGVDRGLSPDKVALIIMLDVRSEERRKNPPEQIVFDAIKLVREKEPQKWKPMSQVEREMAAKLDKKNRLEKQVREIDDQLNQKERALYQAEAEMRELREYPADRQPDIDVEKLNRDLETLVRRLQEDINRSQAQRQSIVAVLDAAKRDIDRQEAIKYRERQAKREHELAKQHERIAIQTKRGRLNQQRLFAAVDKYLGVPYRFGGDSEQGMDCSAFTRRVYRSQNVELPRTSREQARVCTSLSYDSLTTGDLVFFNTSINGLISHVGVYLGNGMFAHASSSKGVTKSSIRERYYVKRFVKGGRVFND